jgi:DNA-binding protein HU-beta
MIHDAASGTGRQNVVAAAFHPDSPRIPPATAQSGGFAFDSGGKTRSIPAPARRFNFALGGHDEGVLPAMNKNELIGAVADASGLSRNDATKAVEGVFDTITGALSKGDEVRLVGFGTFSVAKRKASTGRNPRTGEPMTIKASSQPKFKAGKGLKDSVN